MSARSTPVLADRTPANFTSMALDPRLQRDLSTAGRKTDEWREKRDELIRLAHVDGASLREIAAAVGLSNPGVLRILRKGTSQAAPLIAESLVTQMKRRDEAEARARREKESQ